MSHAHTGRKSTGTVPHLWAEDAAEPKVADFGVAVRIQEDVRRLDVAVEDARAVNVAQALRDADEEVPQAVLFKVPVRTHVVAITVVRDLCGRKHKLDLHRPAAAGTHSLRPRIAVTAWPRSPPGANSMTMFNRPCSMNDS